MSRKEMVLLASRIFALLLTSWVLVELTYLPERISTLRHHITLRSVMMTSDYAGRYYVLLLAMNVLRILVLSLVAILFWRCGPRIEALLAPQHSDATNS
jgi:hypothetical protein